MKNKIIRAVVSILLVCILIFNITPIRAEASVLGTTATVALFGDDAIAIILGALAGLGVFAVADSEISDLEMRSIARSAMDAMEEAGIFVKNGALSVYTSLSEAWSYAVSTDMVQWLHDWIFDSQVVGIEGIVSNPGVTVPAGALATAYAAPFAFFSYVEYVRGAYTGGMSFVLVYSYESPIIVQYGDAAGNGWTMVTEDRSATAYYCTPKGSWNKCTGTISVQNTSQRLVGPTWIGTEDSMDFVTTHEVSLGVIAPPGADIQTEYGEYIVIVAPNGVPETGGDGDDDEQPKIPVLPVPYLPPNEIPNVPQEEIWKGNKVEIETPDSGGSTDPTTGTDTDSDTSVSATPWEQFKKWISEGWNRIINAIPSAESIGQSIGKVIRELFIPSLDTIAQKVGEMRDQFPFIDGIISTGVAIRDGLSYDIAPPEIWIDLGEATTDTFGHKKYLITDFSWYAPYKPRVDALLSAALWAFFSWRVFVRLPSIIGGEGGQIESYASHMHALDMKNAEPEEKKRRGKK